jgi:diguanylate cyclase (GGDEF)-like protein
MSHVPRDRVFSEQIRLLYRGGSRSTSLNYLAMAITAALLYGKTDSVALGIWMLALVVITTVRLALIYKDVPYDHFFEDPDRKLMKFVVGVALQGITWAAGLAYFVPLVPPLYQGFIFLLVVLAIAVTMITYSTSILTFFVFLFSSVTLPLVTLMTQGQNAQIILGLLVIASCSILSGVYVWNYLQLGRAIRLRFERGMLVDTLQQANENLEDSNKRLKIAQEKLTRASMTDELTGVANRRHFKAAMAREWRLARRHNNPVSCLMIDIDYFKRYNDSYGHQRGDEILKRIAQEISFHMKRPADLAARYGGEEFVVLLPETSNDAAFMLAERMANGIAALHIPHESSPFGEITVCIGVATVIPGEGDKEESLVRYTDMALYEAKNTGRNRVNNAGDIK